MKSIIVIFAAILVAALAVSKSSACSCIQKTSSTVRTDYCTHTFTGVVKVTSSAWSCPSPGGRCFSVKPLYALRGCTKAVSVIRTPSNIGLCGVNLVNDQEYLVIGTPSAGVLKMNLCDYHPNWTAKTCDGKTKSLSFLTAINC